MTALVETCQSSLCGFFTSVMCQIKLNVLNFNVVNGMVLEYECVFRYFFVPGVDFSPPSYALKKIRFKKKFFHRDAMEEYVGIPDEHFILKIYIFFPLSVKILIN